MQPAFSPVVQTLSGWASTMNGIANVPNRCPVQALKEAIVLHDNDLGAGLLGTMEIIRMEMVLVLPDGVPTPASGKHPFRGVKSCSRPPTAGGIKLIVFLPRLERHLARWQLLRLPSDLPAHIVVRQSFQTFWLTGMRKRAKPWSLHLLHRPRL